MTEIENIDDDGVKANQEMGIAGLQIPLVAIVILNWNGKSFLEKFLPSVIASTYTNKKIIVADNASTDDSVNFLQLYYPGVELIINGENGGFAKGYNLALKQVTADYFVLLNSDIEVTAGWIEPVIALMECDKKIAACQPKILSWHNKSGFEYAGAAGGWIDKYGYPFARGRVFDFCEEDTGQYDNAAPCFWASGAAFFVRAAVYREMQGLDEYFFAHQEEVDLCWRMQAAGYKIFVEPASTVYHVGGGTLPKGNSKKTFLNFRNNLVMLYKNYPRPAVFFVICFRMMLDAVAAWKGLVQGDGGYFLAILNAHRQFLGWIIFHQGRSLFPASKTIRVPGFFSGSIVWQHFIRHKKRFSEIVTAN